MKVDDWREILTDLENYSEIEILDELNWSEYCENIQMENDELELENKNLKEKKEVL